MRRSRQAPKSSYSLEDGWPEGASEWEIIYLFENIDEKKFTSEQLENLYDRLFEAVFIQMIINCKGSYGYFRQLDRTVNLLVKVIKTYAIFSEKFLELGLPIHCGADHRQSESERIFSHVLHKLLEDKLFCNLVIRYVFDTGIKQMNEISYAYTYFQDKTVEILIKIIKNYETVLETFLKLPLTFHCTTDAWNRESSHIFKQVINELLDDPAIRPKIIDVAQKNKDTIDTSIVELIETRHPGLFSP